MTIVTLSTDFSTGDYACGLMQGVIFSIAPDAKIVDLTHDIPRHNILAGARLLERALPYFPSKTVHVMVIDPGVGTTRRPIAVQLGSQFFVGPDNGLISLVWKKYGRQVVHLNKPQYWLDDVSHIFHGRDVFSPAAAHLAKGVELLDMGEKITDPVLLPEYEPIVSATEIQGKILHIDHFGNLSTNIDALTLQNKVFSIAEVSGTSIHRLVNAFGDCQPGELVALIDSAGYLSICVVNGSAVNRLGVKEGEKVFVRFA